MKNVPDPASLLDDVLAESSPATADSLASVLQAVRARRCRRHLSPALTVLSLALVAAWLVTPRRDTSQMPAVSTAISAPVLETPAERVWSLNRAVERVGSRSLTASERVTTSPHGPSFTRIHTQPGITPGATDEDLFTLAGGRGVALARMAGGRTELLFAHAPQ